MKLRQKENDIDANLSVDQPPYAEIQTEAPPEVPSHSEELLEYSNLNSTLTKYSKIELEQADSKHTHPAMPLRQVKLMFKRNGVQSCVSKYQHMNPPTATNIPQGNAMSI